jgi:hypothetical protein
MQITEPSKLSAMTALERVIHETQAFLDRQGIRKPTPISQKNRRVFLSWTEEKIFAKAEVARRMLDVHLQAEEEKIDLDDSTRLLEIALKALHFAVDPKFYSMIDREDILEVYDSNHVQVFRSFNFFRTCTYNLDDVLAHEWYELYERNEAITNGMLNSISNHLDGSLNISSFSTPTHLLRERFSHEQATFMVRMKKLATIFSGPERKPAFACTGTAKLVPGFGVDIMNRRSSRKAKQQ